MTTTLKACSIAAVLAAPFALADEDATPRTSWGVPDLTGTWDFATITPFNRPAQLADREYLTEEEYNGWNEDAREGRERRERAPSQPAPDPSQRDVDGGYNQVFIDSGKHLSPGRRTSIVVDPPNGRTPGNTMAARMRYAEMRERWENPPRTPADRPPATRCLVGFNAGPPMSSGAYNNLVRIFQSPGQVGILNEMINDHRVIATDGGEHMSQSVRFWKGDSNGRWEGDTFVVETRNFRPETNFRGSGPNMHLTERFTRIDENTLRYEYTVDDPEMFQGEWSTEQDWVRTDSDIYEYACHEGNRSLLMQMRAAKQQYDAGNAVPDETWLPSWYKWMPKKADLLAQQAGEE